MNNQYSTMKKAVFYQKPDVEPFALYEDVSFLASGDPNHPGSDLYEDPGNTYNY